MFGVSFTELLVIMVVALVVFGPERLPEIARKMGSIMAELRKSTDALRREFYNSTYIPSDDFSRQLNRIDRSLTTTKEPQPPAPADQQSASAAGAEQKPSDGKPS